MLLNDHIHHRYTTRSACNLPGRRDPKFLLKTSSNTHYSDSNASCSVLGAQSYAYIHALSVCPRARLVRLWSLSLRRSLTKYNDARTGAYALSMSALCSLRMFYKYDLGSYHASQTVFSPSAPPYHPPSARVTINPSPILSPRHPQDKLAGACITCVSRVLLTARNPYVCNIPSYNDPSTEPKYQFCCGLRCLICGIFRAGVCEGTCDGVTQIFWGGNLVASGMESGGSALNLGRIQRYNLGWALWCNLGWTLG